MNYDQIILEMFERIKNLEEKVKILENNMHNESNQKTDINLSLVERARRYIQDCKRTAFQSGEDNLILCCGDIQKVLGVSNRAPSICLAMKDCMQPNDIVLAEPPSGFSTRFSVEYFLNYSTDDRNGSLPEISLKQLRNGFEDYFIHKKPEYKNPNPLFCMAFFITRHDIGVTLEQLFSKEVSLDSYTEKLFKYFNDLNSKTAKNRTSAYKDAMKNLLEYAEYMHLENVKIL